MKKENFATFSAKSHFGYGNYFDEGLPIEGFGIHPGMFHSIIEVPEDELSNAARTLKNGVLMKDHSDSIDDIIGLIKDTDVKFDENAGKMGVKYLGLIDDEKTAFSVQKGRVKDVSIGFNFEPICSECGEDFFICPHWFDECHIIATNVNVHELSLVTAGADEDAHVSVAEFKAQFNKKLNKKDFKEEKNMTDKKEQVDLTAVFEKATAAEKLAAEKAQEAKDMAAKLAEAEKAAKLAEDEKAKAEAKLSETKDELEKTKDSFSKVSDKLSEQELEAKKEEATEIATLKAEKGLIKEEDVDKEVAELMEEPNLESIKALVEKFEKKEEETFENPPKFENFEKLTKDGKIDYDKPEVRQKFIHEIFSYDRVFKGKEKGQDYVGFNLHN